MTIHVYLILHAVGFSHQLTDSGSPSVAASSCRSARGYAMLSACKDICSKLPKNAKSSGSTIEVCMANGINYNPEMLG